MLDMVKLSLMSDGEGGKAIELSAALQHFRLSPS